MARRAPVFLAACVLAATIAHAQDSSVPDKKLSPAVAKWLQQMSDHMPRLRQLEQKMKALASGPDANKPGNVPPSIFCPLAVEMGLGAALQYGHVAAESAEEFHVVINSMEENDPFDLFYIYSPSGKLLSSSIGNLPKGWHLGFLPGSSGKFYVLTSAKPGCSFEFDASDPFVAVGMATPKD